MMNILEKEDLIKGLPDNVLQQQMQAPTGELPQFLLISEIQRRTDMRKKLQEQPKKETVSEQIMMEGIMSNRPPMQPQMQQPQMQQPQIPPQMEPQMPPMQNQGIADLSAPPMGMAEGGIVKMFQGGLPGAPKGFQGNLLSADNMKKQKDLIYQKLLNLENLNDISASGEFAPEIIQSVINEMEGEGYRGRRPYISTDDLGETTVIPTSREQQQTFDRLQRNVNRGDSQSSPFSYENNILRENLFESLGQDREDGKVESRALKDVLGGFLPDMSGSNTPVKDFFGGISSLFGSGDEGPTREEEKAILRRRWDAGLGPDGKPLDGATSDSASIGLGGGEEKQISTEEKGNRLLASEFFGGIADTDSGKTKEEDIKGSLLGDLIGFGRSALATDKDASLLDYSDLIEQSRRQSKGDALTQLGLGIMGGSLQTGLERAAKSVSKERDREMKLRLQERMSGQKALEADKARGIQALVGAAKVQQYADRFDTEAIKQRETTKRAIMTTAEREAGDYLKDNPHPPSSFKVQGRRGTDDEWRQALIKEYYRRIQRSLGGKRVDFSGVDLEGVG